MEHALKRKDLVVIVKEERLLYINGQRKAKSLSKRKIIKGEKEKL